MLSFLDLIEKINELEPYAFSIVDTFGSLYREDLQRVFYLVHHNLWTNAKIGFHSHNNFADVLCSISGFYRYEPGDSAILL